MTGAPIPPVAPQHAQCKCCGFAAPLYGVVDFTKNCEDRRRQVKPLSGIPIYYYGCPRCSLIFTTTFDHFTPEDFAAQIYNAEYADVDPDYLVERPTGFGQMVAAIFSASRDISVLDYGGGNGVLAACLRTHAFTDVTTYDPFVPLHAERPQRQFDLITCFEVLEHSVRPAQTLDEIVALLNPDGLLLFSTLVIPPEITSLGIGWWYIAPRNGHVTLYSRQSLQTLLSARGLRFGSKDDNLHAAWRTIPEFAKHFIRE